MAKNIFSVVVIYRIGFNSSRKCEVNIIDIAHMTASYCVNISSKSVVNSQSLRYRHLVILKMAAVRHLEFLKIDFIYPLLTQFLCCGSKLWT